MKRSEVSGLGQHGKFKEKQCFQSLKWCADLADVVLSLKQRYLGIKKHKVVSTRLRHHTVTTKTNVFPHFPFCPRETMYSYLITRIPYTTSNPNLSSTCAQQITEKIQSCICWRLSDSFNLPTSGKWFGLESDSRYHVSSILAIPILQTQGTMKSKNGLCGAAQTWKC